MNLIAILIGLFTLFAGGIFYKLFKSTSEVLQKNQDVKNEVGNLQNQVNNNNSQLDSEAQKRQQIEDDLNKKESLNETKDDLLKWLNDNKSSNDK